MTDNSSNDIFSKIENGLKTIQQKIDTLALDTASSVSEKTHQVTDQTKEFVKQLSKQKEDLEAKLEALRGAQQKATHDIKLGIEAAYHDLEQAIEKASDRI